jgi:hypothetical protein
VKWIIDSGILPSGMPASKAIPNDDKISEGTSPDLVRRRCRSGCARNICRHVGIAGQLKYRTLALDLIPGAVIGGIEGVSVANLKVTLGEINLAGYSRILVSERHENRMSVGTCHWIGFRIFDADDV